MFKRIVLFFCVMAMSIFAEAEVHSINILGYRYEDSIVFRVDDLFQKVISQSDFIKPKAEMQKNNAIHRPQKDKTGVFLGIVLILFVVAGVKSVFSYQFETSLNLFDKRNKQRKTRVNKPLGIISLSYYILYFLSLGFMISKYIYDSNKIGWLHLSKPLEFLLVIGVLILLFFIKILFGYLGAWILDVKDDFSNYFYNITFVNKYASLIFFILSILVLLSDSQYAVFFLNLMFILFAISLVLKLFLNYKIALKLFRSYFFHFILYLCTFEIIPVLIVLKILM